MRGIAPVYDIDTAGRPVRVTLDVVADDEDPHAVLTSYDPTGQRLARLRVRADWRLDRARARAWAEAGLAMQR